MLRRQQGDRGGAGCLATANRQSKYAAGRLGRVSGAASYSGVWSASMGIIEGLVFVAALCIALVVGLIWGLVQLVTAPARAREAAARHKAWEEERRRRELEAEALARAITLAGVDTMTGREFERYIERVMSDRGYSVSLTPASNDFGVDIVADMNGVKHAVQVKRRKSKITGAAVSAAVAGKAYYGCEKAMVVTNSEFTEPATQLARANGCILINRTELAQWIIDYQPSAPNLAVIQEEG